MHVQRDGAVVCGAANGENGENRLKARFNALTMRQIILQAEENASSVIAQHNLIDV